MKKSNKGLTLVELLVIIAILGILFCLVLGGTQSVWNNTEETFIAEVVRKYEVVTRNSDVVRTVYRVDVKRPGTDFIETLINEDNMFQGKNNSATIHANLLEHHQYEFKTRGKRSEAWSMFPNIEHIKEIKE